ncbi:MAG TPA: phosphatase PAP2 family protein [Candidatus Cloacimonas sp.]|nr:phosphatase PAP2 family protein [Candidatus Cloacimonas sp.]HQO17730.1 phosphatase PAP2 family protein [Candidatus Cloacimonas sp.]
MPEFSAKHKQTAKSFLSAIDLITLSFCGWILLYMVLGISRSPEVLKHIPVYLAIFTAVLFLAWLQKQPGWCYTPNNLTKRYKVLSFFRGLYPVFLFGYFYTSGYAFNRILFRDWLDPFFMKIDKAIFGYLPSIVWGKHYAHWAIQELFHFAYFCYYPMIAGIPLYLYFTQKGAFKEVIFNLTFVFYCCYTIYSVLPVMGGRYLPEAMALTKTYHSGPFTRIMAFIYRTSNHLGGAFPSSHIAIALVLTIAALRYIRPVGYVCTVISFFLSIATVFCHYHWFIDAVFGILTGIAGYYAANLAHRRLKEKGFS